MHFAGVTLPFRCSDSFDAALCLRANKIGSHLRAQLISSLPAAAASSDSEPPMNRVALLSPCFAAVLTS